MHHSFPYSNPASFTPPPLPVLHVLVSSPSLSHVRLFLASRLHGATDMDRPPVLAAAPPLSDVSGGAEATPVPWENTVDDDEPPPLNYVTRSVPDRDVDLRWALKPDRWDSQPQAGRQEGGAS